MELKFMVLVILFSILCGSAIAFPPYPSWRVYQSIKKNTCTPVAHEKGDLEDICQRCAKATQSPSVYPMCCTNTEEVQTWCIKAMQYGH